MSGMSTCWGRFLGIAIALPIATSGHWAFATNEPLPPPGYVNSITVFPPTRITPTPIRIIPIEAGVEANRFFRRFDNFQFDTRCTPDSKQQASSFAIVGRGGLPPNPRTDVLTPDAVQVDWVSLKPSTRNHSNLSATSKPKTVVPEPIVEATGWVVNEKGQVVLTANAPTVSPHGSWQNFCRALH